MSLKDFPIVDTIYGQVKGRKIQSDIGFEYYGFTGIPYMKQPLGKLRFKEAQAPEKWTNVFDATKEIPSYCITSFMTSQQEGQEDAAIVNVFTKNIKSDKKLPVMVWVCIRF
jgi:carboxylesterase type B